MRKFCLQLKRIIEVAFWGISRKPEAEYIPQKRVLSNDSYEATPIIYKARPIGQEKNGKLVVEHKSMMF